MLGDEWTIESAGGSTGEAYLAKSRNKQLFLKRNSSPFLAVLSAQGIVPKLVWTKRLENGDVITAQEWIEANELNPEVLQHPKVAELLGRIHHSPELLDMLTRMGKKPMNPIERFYDLKNKLNKESLVELAVKRAFNFMEQHLTTVLNVKPVVCHCDLNHNNWMITEKGQLYLIDWDNAEIGDPAMDLGLLFHRYIPINEWDRWLQHYQVRITDNLLIRMHWYMLYDELNAYFRMQTVDKKVLKQKEIEHINERIGSFLNKNE